MKIILWQWLSRLFLHSRHVPHELTKHPTPTRSPISNLVTPGPFLVTMPTISWPGTLGYLELPHSLRTWCRSLRWSGEEDTLLA